MPSQGRSGSRSGTGDDPAAGVSVAELLVFQSELVDGADDRRDAGDDVHIIPYARPRVPECHAQKSSRSAGLCALPSSSAVTERDVAPGNL